LLWALLPNKSQTTYVEMFTALRDRLVHQFNNVGDQHTFLVDYEIAVINALSSIFPESKVKGCSFHYRQAIIRHVQKEGLITQYEDVHNPDVRNWIRRILSLTVLPNFVIPLAWEWLKVPPPSGQSDVDAKAAALALYVERTWIFGDFQPSLWSHYDHNGPRTTNVAEGFHNGMNSRFGMPHPSLRLFLDWLQKCQYEVQCRLIQLDAGRPPKPRVPKYVKLDADISLAKYKFGMDIGQIFAYMFPRPLAWVHLQTATINFLNYSSHLLMG